MAADRTAIRYRSRRPDDAALRIPAAHWAKLHSTNPLERLNGEIKRGPQNTPIPTAQGRSIEAVTRAITKILPNFTKQERVNYLVNGKRCSQATALNSGAGIYAHGGRSSICLFG